MRATYFNSLIKENLLGFLTPRRSLISLTAWFPGHIFPMSSQVCPSVNWTSNEISFIRCVFNYKCHLFPRLKVTHELMLREIPQSDKEKWVNIVTE